MKKRAPEEEGEGAWLISYGDLVTNLMAVFVMITAISTIDPQKLKKITKSIGEAVGGESAPPIRNLTQELIDEINRIIKQNNLENDLSAIVTPDGVLISAKGSAFFSPGSAELMPQSRSKITRLVEHLAGLPYYMEIIGHSDTVPIHTEQFPSNWELSGARATNLARFFIEKGYAPNKIRAIAAADSRPVAPDYAEDGTPLPENQAKNRRVELLIFSSAEPKDELPPPPPQAAGEAESEAGEEDTTGTEEGGTEESGEESSEEETE